MTRAVVVVSLVAGAALVSCDGSGVTRLDGGPRTPRDGASADARAAADAADVPDAGMVAMDAATEADGGTESDAGAGTPDAGPAPMDAGPSCVGEPTCGLVPECGCAAGQMCDVANLQTGERHCIATGTDRELTPCTTGSCAPGLRCLGEGIDALCARYCLADADCAPGASCVDLVWTDGGGALRPTPDAHMCTVACDPIAQVGCPSGYACGIGYSIQGGRSVGSAGCLVAGPQAEGQPCSDTSRCRAGTMCLLGATGQRCVALCSTMAPACVEGRSCRAVAPVLVIAGVQYGLCG